MKKLLYILLLMSVLQNSFAQKLNITKNWKFIKGDDFAYKNEKFDDSAWRKIEVNDNWENQLNDLAYDGFGWYRWQQIIPSSMKKEATKYGGFILQLGKIDDAEQTFFNGELIGENGKFPPENATAWDVQRKYIIPLSKIKWDKPNTIAVRVWDSGGGGGLYGGEYEFEPLSWKDKVEIEINYPFENSEVTENQAFKVNLLFKNGATENINGKMYCDVKTYAGNTLKNANKNLKIKGLNENKLTMDFDGLEKGFYILHFTFINNKGYKLRVKKGLAVSPIAMISKPTLPNDFDDFWKKTRAELDAVSPDFKIIPQPNWTSATKETFLVEMQSLDNVKVRAWFTIPKGKKNLPCLLKVQGYGTIMSPDTTIDDMAVLALNIRGHGNSRDDVNPGFPGFLQYKVEDKEKYIYRGAYMDCVRAVDFFFTRQEVDNQRIAVEGGSQGGALSFATAALDKRVKFCAPDVPFLSDFPTYFNIASWPGNEFVEYQKNTKRPWNEIYQVLNYFDIKNLATKITCPLVMSVGLFDDICPPQINFAAYNNLATQDKKYFLYPNSAHALPSAHNKRKLVWIRDFMKK
jgi:cephalosporin-C deacetylase